MVKQFGYFAKKKNSSTITFKMCERENIERKRVSIARNENEIVLMSERVAFALGVRMFINETDTCKLSICEAACPCYFTCGLMHNCYLIFSLPFFRAPGYCNISNVTYLNIDT